MLIEIDKQAGEYLFLTGEEYGNLYLKAYGGIEPYLYYRDADNVNSEEYIKNFNYYFELVNKKVRAYILEVLGYDWLQNKYKTQFDNLTIQDAFDALYAMSYITNLFIVEPKFTFLDHVLNDLDKSNLGKNRTPIQDAVSKPNVGPIYFYDNAHGLPYYCSSCAHFDLFYHPYKVFNWSKLRFEKLYHGIAADTHSFVSSKALFNNVKFKFSNFSLRVEKSSRGYCVWFNDIQLIKKLNIAGMNKQYSK